jgi:hypothetical protein
MWTKFMEVKTGYAAQIWREFFQHEGLAIQILPPLDGATSMMHPREIWVPDSKTHVAAELMRKI